MLLLTNIRMHIFMQQAARRQGQDYIEWVFQNILMKF